MRLLAFVFILNMYVHALHYDDNDCTQLSEKSLTVILGQAYNPRYMSIESPGSQHEETAYGYKRSSNELPFYMDTEIVSVGEFPAWETDHLNFYAQKQEKTHSMRRRSTYALFERFASGMTTKSDMFKSRPWECLSKINWIDLGSQYFPRYIRSVECTTKKCWYGHFDCKPKSFAIKVLRRKTGACIRVNEKLIIVTADNFDKEYAELWIWEEIAIDFCCECVMKY